MVFGPVHAAEFNCRLWWCLMPARAAKFRGEHYDASANYEGCVSL